jgi:ATP-dependent RNA helicase DeaD
VLDVRAKRLEITRGSIRELLVGGELDRYRVVVEALSGEFDVMDIAAAAVQLAHSTGAGAGGEEAELAPPPPVREKKKPGAHAKGATPARKPQVKMARIFIGSGRSSNMRPADLVGAIANEAGIESKQIGTIEIAERHALVELPEELVEQVITALRATKIKGKRQTVRRDKANREGPGRKR